MTLLIVATCCSLALAWLGGKLFTKLGLPDLLGMILVGIVLGPHMKDLFFAQSSFVSWIRLPDESMILSSPARSFALIVILLRAGLGIDRATIKNIGWPAARMASIPCIFEGVLITILGPQLFDITYLESMCLGFVLAAVSPAIIVPAMLELRTKALGKKHDVPALVLAGASVDDIFAITLFTAALTALGNGGEFSFSSLALSLPLQIITGVSAGFGIGYLLNLFFTSVKLPPPLGAGICVLAATGLYLFEHTQIIPISSLLGIMCIGFYLNEKCDAAPEIAPILSSLWSQSKLALFFFIGAEVDAPQALDAGVLGSVLILMGLCGRWVGVWISLLHTKLTTHERIFCLIAYIPKATVQAAIGAVALTMVTGGQITLSNGVQTGQLILAIAVVSILITAPLGSLLISKWGPFLLKERD